MIDELIRKSDVIATLNNWLEGEETETLFGIGYSGAVRDIIKLIETEKPINAVELPCKIGDMAYFLSQKEVCCDEVREIQIDKKNIWILTKYGYTRGLYETFFSREEAEKALEDLKNDK